MRGERTSRKKSRYQPSTYWATRVSYGSCSHCDALQGIQDETSWDQTELTERQIEQYMTLALHMIQKLKEI